MAENAELGPLSGVLPDDMVLCILARLPAKSVLRFRVVCRAWRALTIDRYFLLEHRRCQTLQPLVNCCHYAADPGDQVFGQFFVGTLNFRTGEVRAVIESSIDGDARDNLHLEFHVFDDDLFRVHASCDGLLLFHFLDGIYVCNPATRQRAHLPPLHSSEIAALYAHDDPSRTRREYRVLYHRGRDLDKNYYIITLSALGDPRERTRCIGRFASSASLDAVLARGPSPAFASPPLQLHDCLHWLPQEGQDQEDRMLVFDTVTEVFWWMRPPPVVRDNVALLEVDGKLAMSACGWYAAEVELWLLQDYKNEVWVCAHRIGLPVGEISRFDDGQAWFAFVRSQDGDVLVLTPTHVLHLRHEWEIAHGLG